MDTSNSSATKDSNLSHEAKNPLITPSEKVYFQGPYRPQNRSLPDSLIFHMAKNPSTSKCYPKTVQSCKYFFVKNPVIFASDLRYEKQWTAIFNKKSIGFSNVLKKFWISGGLQCKSTAHLISSIIPKLYRVDVTYLDLANQIISLKDFTFLSSNAKHTYLFSTMIKNEDGSNVRLEGIISVLPKVEVFHFDNNFNSSSATLSTVTELLKVPHFIKIKHFRLFNPSELFDIEAFFNYAKTNKSAAFVIYCCGPISEGYRNRLHTILEEMFKVEYLNYKPLELFFDGMGQEKLQKMQKLRDKYE